MLRGKPSVLGFCSGAVAGLVVINARVRLCDRLRRGDHWHFGRSDPLFAVWKLKAMLGYDDALDTSESMRSAHPRSAANRNACPHESNGESGDEFEDKVTARLQPLVFEPAKAILVTLAWQSSAPSSSLYVVKAVVGLRPTPEVRPPAGSRGTRRRGYPRPVRCNARHDSTKPFANPGRLAMRRQPGAANET